MAEFESRRSSFPAFPSARPSSEIATVPSFDIEREPPSQREGLPPGYRMRADPHYVEQLTARVPLPPLRALPVGDIDSARAPDDAELDELVTSIGRFGVLQPLLVRSRGTRFELIAGSRRLAAARQAGLSDVPCLVYACDEVRARALAEADNVRSVPPPPAASAPPIEDLPGTALEELRRSFGTIESCLHLLGDRDSSLRDRVALDLVRTESHRATRMVRALAAVTTQPALSLSPVSVRTVVEQVLEALAPERRLAGVDVQTEIGEGAHLVSGDTDWLAVAIAGALGGMIAFVQGTRHASVTLRLITAPSRATVTLELAQSVVPVPTRLLQRFFDAGWTDRPGGYQAAVELAATKQLTDRHRGTAEVVAGERGGNRLALVLPGIV